MTNSKPLFRDLNADDTDPEATEIESLCMNCHATGLTRLLLTKIPFYKELVLMSFTCEECGYENKEIQSGATIADKGVRITVKISSQKDLNRILVKSDYTSIKIVELEFEIPAKSQKGEVTTVEGVITRSIWGLEQDQAVRRIHHPEAATQIDEFIEKMQKLKKVETPFTMILQDISGNSFLDSPYYPKTDKDCSITYFTRTKEQDHELGIFTQEEVSGEREKSILHPVSEEGFSLQDLEGEVLHFPTNCPNCSSPCQTNMKMTNIPHFKQVVIMATTCDICGNRTNEVKSGCGIEPKGVKIEVDVETRQDLSRDVLKSDTCDLKIPQLELEVGPHALGGRFTTMEGLLTAVKTQLLEGKHMFGDSVDANKKSQYDEFFGKFDDILNSKLAVTVVLDDPAGNSYIQNTNVNDEPDGSLRITHYERSHEQNEELGLNDMKTDNYVDA